MELNLNLDNLFINNVQQLNKSLLISLGVLNKLETSSKKGAEKIVNGPPGVCLLGTV